MRYQTMRMAMRAYLRLCKYIMRRLGQVEIGKKCPCHEFKQVWYEAASSLVFI